jgi:hypothetical protein
MTIDDLELEELKNQNMRLRRELSEATYKLSQITDAYDFVRSGMRQELIKQMKAIPAWEDPTGFAVVALKDVISVITRA